MCNAWAGLSQVVEKPAYSTHTSVLLCIEQWLSFPTQNFPQRVSCFFQQKPMTDRQEPLLWFGLGVPGSRPGGQPVWDWLLSQTRDPGGPRPPDAVCPLSEVSKPFFTCSKMRLFFFFFFNQMTLSVRLVSAFNLT